jgi:hypothetical protein
LEALRHSAYRYNPLADVTYDSVAVLAVVLCIAVCVANPGILIGTVIAYVFLFRRYELSQAATLTVAVVFSLVVFLLRGDVIALWPWRMIPATGNGLVHLGISRLGFSPLFVRSAIVELLLGPLVLVSLVTAREAFRRTMRGQLYFERRHDLQRRQAVTGPRLITGDSSDPSSSRPPGDDRILLGVDRESRRRYDLRPSELAQHVFLLGAYGTGKTTTIARLANGALALDPSSGHRCGVVFVDCKAGDLKETAQHLAARWNVPFALVDANDPDSLGYNVCSGDAADITNKLIGAFSYSDQAEIYKNVALDVVPLLVQTLMAASSELVTLRKLTQALAPDQMLRMSVKAGEPYKSEIALILKELDRRGLVPDGITGLRERFNSLLRGRFGPLFTAPDDGRPVLDWAQVLSQPSVTYISLPATALSEDVELAARVVAQDLKQQCARRIRHVASGQQLVPTLIFFDEFAALREAEQMVDLLLQARQAQMSTVISTQLIPEKVTIRKAVLQAGLIIAHRAESEDCEVISAQFGTRPKWEYTVQIDQRIGPTGLGSVHRVDTYVMHPNDLRRLRTGYAAVRSVFRDEAAIVEVAPLWRDL